MRGIWYPSLRNKWVKCPVSHTISSLILTFFSESHLQQLWSWFYWWFSMFLILYYLDFFCKEYLFLFLFSKLCKNPLIYVFYFIFGFIIQYYCYSLYPAFFSLQVLSVCLLCTFIMTPFLYYVSTSFIALTKRCFSLRCIFPALTLESNISPKSSSPLGWRMPLETKTWVVVVLSATQVSVLLRDHWLLFCQFRSAIEPL